MTPEAQAYRYTVTVRRYYSNDEQMFEVWSDQPLNFYKDNSRYTLSCASHGYWQAEDLTTTTATTDTDGA